MVKHNFLKLTYILSVLLVLKHFTYFNKFLGYDIVSDLELLDLYKHIVQRMSDDGVNDGVTALEVAAKDENVLLCEIIIRIIKELNLEEYDRLTPFKNVSNTILGLDDLHESFFKRAATKGYLQVFELLIKNLPTNKNPIFNSGGSPLHLAAENGHLEACQLILSNVEEKNPYINWEWVTPYHLAAQNGQLEVCKLFIENLQNKNPENGRIMATPLLRAASRGHSEICKLIIQNLEDKNPTTYEGTPLHLAAQEGHIEVCKLFMENTKNQNPDVVFKGTPLHLAAGNGHLNVCKLFMEKISTKNPFSRYNWTTPLHKAAENGHLEVCDLIIKEIKLGSYPGMNPEDENQMTPLHLAARNGHIDVCRLIMKNPWNKNPKLLGATPKKLAYENDHMEIYEMFETEIGSFSSKYSSVCNVFLTLPLKLRQWITLFLILLFYFCLLFVLYCIAFFLCYHFYLLIV